MLSKERLDSYSCQRHYMVWVNLNFTFCMIKSTTCLRFLHNTGYRSLCGSHQVSTMWTLSAPPLAHNALYFLRQRRTHSTPTIILSLTLLLLFVSTTTYLVANSIITLAELLDDTLKLILLDGDFSQMPSILQHVESILGGSGMCVITGTLTFNVSARFLLDATSDVMTLKILLGDAIVCWRASVLWPGNRIVKGISVSVVILTFGALTPVQ